jgi:hypothetical protein
MQLVGRHRQFQWQDTRLPLWFPLLQEVLTGKLLYHPSERANGFPTKLLTSSMKPPISKIL